MTSFSVLIQRMIAFKALQHVFPRSRLLAGRVSLRACVTQRFESNESEDRREEKTKEVISLEEENRKLISQIKELDDKYKRALAEAENTRVRYAKHVEEAKAFGIQSFCKDLLNVSDILEKALESVPKEVFNHHDNHQKNHQDTYLEHLRNLFKGLEMTEKELQNVFKRHGLTKINPLGHKFDPNLHHALFEVPEVGKEPGSVASVTQVGYKLRERVVRPAMVGVVKRSVSG